MKKFDSRSYSIADFLEWHSNSLLDLSPKYQRRSVWTRAAKSFLIDTILRGKPMPKVLLTQDLRDKRNVRTVVDGQQRIRTILEFTSGSFTVLKAHNVEHHGKTFQQLDPEAQDAILQYEIGVDLLFNVGLSDMLDIFARINTYSVILNRQEKLNATYLGVFKTSAYEIGHTYADYFLSGKIITDKQLSRMGEAQLSSDMLVSLVGGVQTRKNIEKYYKMFDDADIIPDEIVDAKNRFSRVMAFVGAIYSSEDLSSTNWSRPHWFYTLFTCVAHAFFGLIGLEDAPRPPADSDTVDIWRSALDEISARYDEFTADDVDEVPRLWASFINYAQRRTTDTEARIERAKFVLGRIGT
jgi:Protein of unknown function DUF262